MKETAIVSNKPQQHLSCNILLGISLFLFSLSSFSKLSGFISLLILLVYLSVGFHQYRLRMGVVYYFISLIVFVTIVTLYTQNFMIYYFYYHFYLLYIFLFFLVVSLYSFRSITLIINAYLLIHLLSFITQTLVFYVFDYYVDFYDVIPDSKGYAAYIAKELKGTWVALRPTGFFTEPSFFSMAILPGILFKIINNDLKCKVFIGSVAVVLLSFSIAAVIVMMLIIFILILKNVFRGIKLKQLILLFGLLLLFFFFSGDFLYSRVFESQSIHYDPIEYRMGIFSELYARTLVENLIGVGFFLNEHSNDNGITGLSAAGIRDSGLWLSTLYSAGIIGVVLFLIYIWQLCKRSVFIFLIVASIFLMKYSIVNACFWLVLLMLLIPSKDTYITGSKVR